METKEKLTKEQTLELVKQAHAHLDIIEGFFTQIFKRTNARINFHLRQGDFYYNGRMLFRDQSRKPLINENCDKRVYEDLAPYCYNKINGLLKQGKIRFEDSKFKIIE